MYTLNPIGAFAKEVEGLSLWETQDELTIARLADIWSRHGVLVFRRQVLSETELVDFSCSFGDPDVIVREDWSSSHTPEVIQISNMKNYHGQSIAALVRVNSTGTRTRAICSRRRPAAYCTWWKCHPSLH